MSAVSPYSNPLLPFELTASLFRGLDAELAEMVVASSDLARAMDNFAAKFAARFNPSDGTAAGVPAQCAPVGPPEPVDSCHPAGSLRAEGNAVTTAGGYRIEMLGQYEWKITGPDGNSTRVWGDPHVDEKDGGRWDFKRNSTFVLGDGTRVNVTTVPGGAPGMTVTGQLEIISGNERVQVSDIDKGAGRIGAVTRDGYQSVNGFGGADVFVMGRETDDWSLQGREIVGSENGGESFKLGGNLDTLTGGVSRFGDGNRWAASVFDGLLRQWQDSWRPSDLGCNAYSDRGGARWERHESYDRARHVRNMRRSLRALGEMFTLLSKLMRLNEQVSAGRRRPLQA